MGSTLIGESMLSQLMLLSNWQLLQDGEGEDSSLTSSSIISNFKSSAASLNVVDDYVYMLEGGVPHVNSLLDSSMNCQRLPSLSRLSVAIPSLNASSISKDNYSIKHEEAHSSITKDDYFFNPHDTKAFKYPLDFDDNNADSTIAPTFIKNIQHPYDQNHNMENALVPEYALLQYEHSIPPSPPTPFVSEDTYSKHFLDKYESSYAADSHVNFLAQHFNEALLTPSNAAYMSYLPCATFTTSPTPPSIISTGSSPITSLTSRTSAIADTASMDAASMAPDRCQDNHFLNSSEMMPSLLSLHTRSVMSKTSKAKNAEIDKTIKKKRKRTRSRKNTEELESQRMTHIAVERNRRRQMNQHLNDLRSLMPSSYIQRGDQASIVGGAIRLVEELEQVLESLHLQKQIRGGAPIDQVPVSHLVADNNISIRKEAYACTQSSMVDVQVEMVSLSSIFVKVIAPKRHHQLLHTLQALTFLSLKVLHLNITTLDITIIYSFNLKVENECQFQSPLEIAKSIQHVFETPKTPSSE